MPGDAQARLEEKVARGEVVPMDELNRVYAAAPADVDSLASRLKAQGYEIVDRSSDGIYARHSGTDRVEPGRKHGSGY